ncbi:hypothetical protein [Candidatus Deianiraea vastatrix]|uniref:Uncharacterized protein n=1 Tax=Candidatus Deianiraea vastatrix TaxID=2163644 RepID=A0A5B8XFV8_9RICK|nr:hypothetical protein [Candidatus Deianiraea vastatrix]QED23234.1 hypothetical protein Deia_00433 [Candidatus Deianiraea vastatrix]
MNQPNNEQNIEMININNNINDTEMQQLNDAMAQQQVQQQVQQKVQQQVQQQPNNPGRFWNYVSTNRIIKGLAYIAAAGFVGKGVYIITNGVIAKIKDSYHAFVDVHEQPYKDIFGADTVDESGVAFKNYDEYDENGKTVTKWATKNGNE